MEEKKTNDKVKEVHFGDKLVGEMEMPQIDVAQYIGKKSVILEVKEFQGEFGPFISIWTDIIDTIERGNSDPIQLRASKMFGLTEVDGKIGWGKESKLAVFLKKHGVSHYKDLVGKTVVVQTIQNKKDGKDYLTF
jgi:hypothetical protein